MFCFGAFVLLLAEVHSIPYSFGILLFVVNNKKKYIYFPNIDEDYLEIRSPVISGTICVDLSVEACPC